MFLTNGAPRVLNWTTLPHGGRAHPTDFDFLSSLQKWLPHPFLVFVQSEDILYILSRDILYTPRARARGGGEGWLGRRWMYENRE